MLAASRNDVELLDRLLQCGSDTLDKNELDYAFIRACWRGHLNCATKLLDAGSDIEAEDVDGDTPLILACSNNHYCKYSVYNPHFLYIYVY